MNINPCWKYRDIIVKVWALKTEYQEVLASFCYARDRNEFMRKVKTQIYSLKIHENRKDEIWNIMNYKDEYEGEYYNEENFKFNDWLL